jgi:hypothetical protein
VEEAELAQQAQIAALVGQAAGRTLRFDETTAAALARRSPARRTGSSVADAVALAGSPSRFSASSRSLPVW